jgi:hypothetical protein
MNMFSLGTKNKRIITLVLSLDALLISLHLIFSKNYSFFNLDMEYNLPSAYSSVKLIIIGILSFLIFFKTKRKIWLIFSSIFVFLGFDEFFEIHERVGNYLAQQGLNQLEWYSNPVFYWTLAFLPLIILVSLFIAYFIIKFLKKNRSFFTVGFLCFLMVIVLEVIGGFITDKEGLYQTIVVFEESFEIFGATMFLVGVLNSS